MNFVSVILYTFEALAAISAIGILFTKNVFYGALLLIVCLLSMAGIYVILNAEFAAVTQILVYAGGIIVLIIFGVMLTSKISGKALTVKTQYWFGGMLAGLSFLLLLVKFFSEVDFYNSSPVARTSSYNSINHIGILFMTDYVLPFEITGVLLLVALLGAAVVASSATPTNKP